MIKSKKNIKIAAATGMTLFSLVATFTAAIAWFCADNSEVTAKPMIVMAKNTAISLVSVEVHKCVPDRCTSTTLAFNSTVAFTVYDSSTPSSSLVIDDYGDLNKSQPVLLLFNLKANTVEGDVTITADTDTSTFLQSITSANVNKYPLSNAVYFRSAAFNRPGDTFQFSTIAVSSLTQTTRFTSTLTAGSATSQHLTVFSGGSSEATITHVAVVMDYYVDAVEAIKAVASQSSFVTNNNNRLGFDCDWSMVVS